MKINNALDQIYEIHQHLSKTEYYRGLRALPVAISGIIGFLGAILQNVIIGATPDILPFLLYWFSIAVLNLTIGLSNMLWRYVYTESQRERKKGIQLAEQFIPCLAAGLIVSLACIRLYSTPNGSMLIVYRTMPGLWCTIYALTVSSARPFLPRMMGFVALYYLVCGAALIFLSEQPISRAQWGYIMGIVFGIGQLAMAAVLFWNLERKDNGRQ